MYIYCVMNTILTQQTGGGLSRYRFRFGGLFKMLKTLESTYLPKTPPYPGSGHLFIYKVSYVS